MLLDVNYNVNLREKINYNKYNYVLDGFSSEHPMLADKVVDWVAISEYEVIFTLDNEERVKYNFDTGRITFIKTLEFKDEREWAEWFGAKFRRRIRATGKNHDEIAKDIGITSVSLSRYLNGTRIPDAHTIYKLQHVLNSYDLLEDY